MHVQVLLASSLWTATALAFRDTSPFFLFSTSDLAIAAERQVASYEHLTQDLSDSLQHCPSDVYVLVSQPGVSAEDFQDSEAATYLRRRASGRDSAIKSKLVIPEVVGRGLDIGATKNLLERRCSVGLTVYGDIEQGIVDTASGYPHILQIDLPALPTSGAQRRSKLAEHDSFINAAIRELNTHSYTLIYHATPPSHAVHEQSLKASSGPSEHSTFDWELDHASPEALHMDLKRDVGEHPQKRQNESDWNPPLFEKYNFFSSGIFMGGIAVILLFSIGTVGVSALSSIQVPYAAFSKEMGPAAQKKEK